VILKAPFPWFGGKSRVAALAWQALGEVRNYVEPFAGSLAVLLARPHAPGTETVNDKDAYLANFWRALRHDPEAVAAWADWPVSEPDLHARHLWLRGQADFRERMLTDPDFYDAKIAGWWVWGQCAWIGSGWCAIGGRTHGKRPRPALGSAGQGINRQLPHLGDAGRGERILAYLLSLAARLHAVRVACGPWHRVCGPSVTFRHGLTGVFLDPPYSDAERERNLYATDDGSVSAKARDWALANGGSPKLRIILCGYEGEHAMPPDWTCVPWKAQGGYGSRGKGRARANAGRERLWLSSHCLPVEAAAVPA